MADSSEAFVPPADTATCLSSAQLGDQFKGLRQHPHPVLASLDCCTKVLQLGDRHLFSAVLQARAHSQGVGRAALPLQALGETPLLSLPALGAPGIPWLGAVPAICLIFLAIPAVSVCCYKLSLLRI